MGQITLFQVEKREVGRGDVLLGIMLDNSIVPVPTFLPVRRGPGYGGQGYTSLYRGA